MSEIRIGISGWTYPPWRGVFYPAALPHGQELEYASRQVNSIEINGTFYGLQKPSSFRAWHEATPDDFVFAVKGSRYLTHLTRLKDPKKPLANFFASGVLELKEKLGPLLWQLPPNFHYDRRLLESFFKLLPRDGDAAEKLARCHDSKLRVRASLKARAKIAIRHALEVRHPSFETAEFVALLREHDIAMVVADTAGKWPLIEDVTADFIYIRLHGPEELYASGYTETALDSWARKIRDWSDGGTPRDGRLLTPPLPKRRAGRDVYAYFDNDAKTHAPFDAISLAKRLAT